METFSTPLEGALWAASRNFKVIPLGAGSKVPVLPGWQKKGSTLPEEIQGWAKTYPDCNFGMVCDGMVVVDLDKKGGVDGEVELKTLLAEEGVDWSQMKTTCVRTPNGLHLYYSKGDITVRNQTSQIASGIDIKTDAGQVVLPGSIVNGRSYTLGLDMDPAGLPNFLVKRLQSVGNEVWSWPEGDGVPVGMRNDTHFRFGLHLQSIGTPRDLVRRCMEIVNEEFTDQPSPPAEMCSTINSVLKREPQQAKILFDFDLRQSDVEGWEGSSSRDIKIAEIPARRWLLEGRYPLGFYVTLLSPGGVGKSTLSLLGAMSLITERPISGRDVIQGGNVWLYNIEDPKVEIERRIAAMAILHGIDLTKTKHYLRYDSGRDRPLTLVIQKKHSLETNWADIKTIIERINEEKFKLLILDPWVQLHGVQENDNTAIAAVVMAVQHILKHTDCCIEIIHHTHKLGDLDSAIGNQDVGRGASALNNGARAASTLLPMSTAAAEQLGVPDSRRRDLIRLDSAKCNILPPATQSDWFERVSVTLPNDESIGALQVAEIGPPAVDQEDQARVLSECLAEHMADEDETSMTQAVLWAREHIFARAFVSGEPWNRRKVVSDLLALNIPGGGMRFTTRQFNGIKIQAHKI